MFKEEQRQIHIYNSAKLTSYRTVALVNKMISPHTLIITIKAGVVILVG